MADYQVQKKDDELLIGIAANDAVMDIRTTLKQLSECRRLLEDKDNRTNDARLGSFGTFPVILNLDKSGRVSLFIDGPEFDAGRVQSSAIWIDQKELLRIIKKVIDD